MKYNDLTIQKLRELSILEVADKLGFQLKGLGDEGRRALCPYHDDKHPSLHFSKKKGIFKCFVCGAKGDLFKLVMDNRNCTFPEACEWLINEFHIVVVPDAPASTSVKSVSSVVEKKTSSIIPQPSAIIHHPSSIPHHPSDLSLQTSDIIHHPSSIFTPLPSDLVTRSLSVDSQFCHSAVSAGYLSEVQLHHAASRYRLGCSKDSGVIFWEIDEQQRVHTGKIMYYQPDCHRDKHHTPTWVHTLMKSQLPANYELQHCLFGLHLLTSSLSPQTSDLIACHTQTFRSENPQTSSIAIVESEKTAVIMSEIVPDFVWMSCGGLQMFKPELLAPLVNHKIVIFPDTDETGDAYRQWRDVATEAQRLYTFRYPLRISRILEDHATPDQKSRKIDLVDYLFEQ